MTDLAITTGAGKTYSFVVQVVADLPVLTAQLRQLFPDATLRLSQIRDHIVVEGQATTDEQRERIARTIRAYLRSVQQSQVELKKMEEEAVAPLPGMGPAAPAPGVAPPPGVASRTARRSRTAPSLPRRRAFLHRQWLPAPGAAATKSAAPRDDQVAKVAMQVLPEPATKTAAPPGTIGWRRPRCRSRRNPRRREFLPLPRSKVTTETSPGGKGHHDL